MNDDMKSIRYSGLVDMDKLEAHRLCVVGVGAVGRQVAIQLATMGAKYLELIDPDIVSDVNLGTQGFLEKDIGKHKVEVVGLECTVRGAEVLPLTDTWQGLARDVTRWALDAMFVCGDNMAVRKAVWNDLHAIKDVGLILDIRVGTKVIHVFSIPHGEIEARAVYEASLFPEEEAQEQACTRRMTIYMANIAAGYMIKQYVTWLMDRVPKPEVMIDVGLDHIFTGADLAVAQEVTA